MMCLGSSPPGCWRGSGDDRWVWIENFRRRHNGTGTKWSTSTKSDDPDTRRCGVRGSRLDRAGSADGAWSAWSQGQTGPSLYPFESTSLNGQHKDDALSRFSNILEFITCHLIRHKSAEMPPKVPFHFFLFDNM